MTAVLSALIQRAWRDEAGRTGVVLRALLAPAESLYRAAVGTRNVAYDRGLLPRHHLNVPVVSIGNVAVGGTGKTPFAHWVAVRLRTLGERPAVLHGGYADDEPALHRRWSPDLPVVVERDRVRGGSRAIAHGATVLVLDDAFQHRRLYRDVDIVLIAAETWDPAARLLPRGPWREPLAGLQRADLIICTRKTASRERAVEVMAALADTTEKPVALVHLRAARWLHEERSADMPAGPVVLVAALAEPGIFADAVRAAGADVAGELLFADHHAYSAEDARRILADAGGRPVVTSEKDWTKLSTLLPPDRVWVLAQDVEVETGADIIDRALQRVRR